MSDLNITIDRPAAATDAAVWALIGRTPLVRLARLEPRPGVQLYAKLESKNPGGSVKDRAAASIIRTALQNGSLRPGKTILDATSGNTGIAYAMLGAAIGYPVTLCVPTNVTQERQRLLRVYGAKIVWTSPMDGSDGAIREARRLYASDPERYFYADQYSNPANWRAHYETTGPEILRQTAGLGAGLGPNGGGGLTHFVAGLGTSGTFMGIGRRLREEKPDVRLISVQPDSPLHGLEGLKHMATAIVPPIYDASIADQNVTVETEAAWRMLRRVAREEGLFIGVSGAAAVVAATRLALTLDRGIIVTILPDGGERYLTDPMLKDGGSDASA